MTLQIQGPAGEPPRTDKWGARNHIVFGLVCVVLLVGGFGTWAVTAQLQGAVIATGEVRVTDDQQVVQHPDGGVVGEILVEEGRYVEGGEVLIRLDGTSMRSELAALEGQLFEIIARRGRLTAEQSGFDTITFDEEVLERAKTDPEVAALVQGQRNLFAARNTTMKRELEVMGERQIQLEEQVAGVDAEMASLARQSELIDEELVGQIRLREQGLARADRVLSLQREKARLEGQLGQRISQKAQLKGQISELEIEKLRMIDTRIEEAITELRELGFRELELKENRIQLRERLDRLDIRAPRAGIIHDLQIHALKSVIRPADPIVYVVPIDTGMVIEAQIDRASIDSIYIGQEASLVFSAFNTRTTPNLLGEVSKKSPDSFTDDRTGETFYRINIDLRPGELDKLEGQELIAGMPVDAFVTTDARTPLNYLVRPMMDYINKAWREE
ncbi:MAG: HlyD family type I secretion periplasmic adaptor subunit [Pseudomonadota bacterium]